MGAICLLAIFLDGSGTQAQNCLAACSLPRDRAWIPLRPFVDSLHPEVPNDKDRYVCWRCCSTLGGEHDYRQCTNLQDLGEFRRDQRSLP
jgi:hypothetical protein